jgi:hypothetical protein
MASWEPQSLFGAPETWASVERIRLGKHDVPVLGGEALLLYLSVHFAFHHVFDGLILLCDLFLVLRRDAERIDWERLLGMAGRYRCRRALYYSLFFVREFLAAQVPPRVLDCLRPPAPIRYLMPSNRLLFREVRTPQMLERYVKFLLIDSRQGRRSALRAWCRSSKPFRGKRGLPRHASGEIGGSPG